MAHQNTYSARSARVLLPLLFVAALGVSCFSLVNFDPSGQRCDDQNRCLDGFVCTADHTCQRYDGGTEGRACSDATPCPPDGWHCAAGLCRPLTCENVICADGAVCIDGHCTGISCAGKICAADEQCQAGTCHKTSCGQVACEAGLVCVRNRCLDNSCPGLSCASYPQTVCRLSACLACAVKEEQCDDEIDDDCDGKIDCKDEDCDGISCDDSNSCTSGEVCRNLDCGTGTLKQCTTPSLPCRSDAGTCNPQTGECIYGLVDAGAPCVSDNRCLVGTTCDEAGSCMGGTAKVCEPTPDAGCVVARDMCDPLVGCVVDPRTDGTPCGSASLLHRCCAGNCVNLSADKENCGGCGLLCGAGATCEAVSKVNSTCGTSLAATLSGRCSCVVSTECPAAQTCQTNYCVPPTTAACAPGQTATVQGTCGNYCAY